MAQTFSLAGFPLSVVNRALEIYGLEEEDTLEAAFEALLGAEARKDLIDGPYSALAQAIAEYMSLTGPWGEDTGERMGESGYRLAFDGEKP